MRLLLLLLSFPLLAEWKATILSKQVTGVNEIRVTVRYTDGVKKFDETYTVGSLTALQAQARTVVARAKATDADAGKVLEGDIDITPPADPIPPAPTADQIAAKAYREKLETYRKARWFVDAGLVPANNAAFLALKTWLVDNFKVAYLDLAQ
jgi:hypothetical protein